MIMVKIMAIVKVTVVVVIMMMMGGGSGDFEDGDYRSIKDIYSCIRNLVAVLVLITRCNNRLV
jgi:hypothetical protein